MKLSRKDGTLLIRLITDILSSLNEKSFKQTKKNISVLKKYSTQLPVKIQKDVQQFIIQADIQKDYDLSHGASAELQKLADKIIYQLRRKTPPLRAEM